jgi:hypothetical protein
MSRRRSSSDAGPAGSPKLSSVPASYGGVPPTALDAAGSGHAKGPARRGSISRQGSNAHAVANTPTGVARVSVVVLCGSSGSRLFPLTIGTLKCLVSSPVSRSISTSPRSSTYRSLLLSLLNLVFLSPASTVQRAGVGLPPRSAVQGRISGRYLGHHRGRDI